MIRDAVSPVIALVSARIVRRENDVLKGFCSLVVSRFRHLSSRSIGHGKGHGLRLKLVRLASLGDGDIPPETLADAFSEIARSRGLAVHDEGFAWRFSEILQPID